MRDELSGKFLKGSQLGEKTQFKKGSTPWNTGTKGVMKANSGSFKPAKVGTIVKKKLNGYFYDYIKRPDGTWKRHYPEGKQIKVEKEKGVGSGNYKRSSRGEYKKKPKHLGPIQRFYKIKKTVEIKKPELDPETVARNKQQKEFLASFGITDKIISIPIKK